MKVLVACEFSGVVREAFAKRGHEAYSCDLRGWGYNRPNPLDRHIKGDVTPLLRERWDLVIAHPPCTYLANSGVWALERDGKARYDLMMEGCRFFNLCLAANAPRVCVENPTQHVYAKVNIAQGYSQAISPNQFGHDSSKRTCLWLKGLPRLIPTIIIQTTKRGRLAIRDCVVPYGETLQGARSITYKGIAEAMAEQWG